MDMAQRRTGTGGLGSGRARLTARDWADAALDAMREGGGLSAVAVEPLAARLGATKGSFYWHFANRDALVAAALARWEESQTEAVIADVARQSDPEARIRKLFAVTAYPVTRGKLELALHAQAAHPLVAAALRRVTERRLGYLTQLFQELGFDATDARHRALLAYTGYLGNAQLAHAVREALPHGADAERYLDQMLHTLLRR
jgi:AcrR family transcriptional regulator